MTVDRDNGTLVTDREAYAGRADRRDIVQETDVIAPRDLVRWGPIFAGLVTAFTLFLLLSVLLLAIGVQAIRVGDPNIDQAAGAGALLTAVIALFSFFVGGFVAARTAALGGRLTGLLNGFLVWGLGLLLVLVLAGMGLGGILGAVGDLFQQYRAAGSPQPDANPADILRGIREASLPAFLSLALPAAAAAIGGFIGARDDVEHAHVTHRS
ncbi:MAG: hypothetical protein M3N29_11140 [Chloroflexota bacterium]|nr:hypothetical protein [Chloroflexota bacterium]